MRRPGAAIGPFVLGGGPGIGRESPSPSAARRRSRRGRRWRRGQRRHRHRHRHRRSRGGGRNRRDGSTPVHLPDLPAVFYSLPPRVVHFRRGSQSSTDATRSTTSIIRVVVGVEEIRRRRVDADRFVLGIVVRRRRPCPPGGGTSGERRWPPERRRGCIIDVAVPPPGGPMPRLRRPSREHDVVARGRGRWGVGRTTAGCHLRLRTGDAR